MWTGAVFTSTGDVVPCCFDKDAQFSMGNINLTSFSNILTNKKYNEFRVKIFNSRKTVDMCCNCTEGLK
jgi:radical SAM protein with 4Fe4S-binding SPASM domain